MNNERCENCRFWLSNGSVHASYGLCRRNSPRAEETHYSDGYYKVNWPKTQPIEWCGQWEKRNDE